DEAMIRAADHVIEIGPEPGARGGEVVFQGTIGQMLRSGRSITGSYLSGREHVEIPKSRRPVGSPASNRKSGIENQNSPWLTFSKATKHNIRDLDFRLPLQRFVCLSGVSGSGKSTLLDSVIHQGLLTQRNQMTEDPAEIAGIKSDVDFAEIVLVDQSPLSRTPRSNAALYCEAWDLIRELYAQTPAAQEAGFSASSFSFNSGDGRCDHCQGLGSERVEMQFLSDVFVPCPICEGRRFKPEVLAIRWNGKSVDDLLRTTIADAIRFFAPQDREASSADASRAASPATSKDGRLVLGAQQGATGTPQRDFGPNLQAATTPPRESSAALADIRTRFASLEAVGLGYLPLGQPLNTLSGGESQRLKLVRYLSDYASAQGGPSSREAESLPSPGTQDPGPQQKGGALLLLDEPTTGLHRHDVKRLLGVLQRIVDQGHSVVVIEHNLDVLKSADWILEVGPEAGANGGRIVAEGPPETIAAAETATSPFLREALNCRAGSPNPASYDNYAASGDPALQLAAAEAPAPYLTSFSGLRTPDSELRILGARENNLKNISVSIPHRQLSVVTGVSGSGKSTLAFDIIFAEGQRRFMESMSPYARQFVEQLPRPAIDRLTGIPPTVAIEQRITRGSRKSTVATITEVAQYLRLLYARAGVQHHPESGRPVTPLSPSQLRRLLDQTLASPKAKKARHLYLCAPLIRGRKGHHEPIANWIRRQGYELMRADGRLLRVDTFTKLDRYKEHDIEVVVADLKSPPEKGGAERRGAADHLTTALRLGKGSCFIVLPTGEVLSWFSTTRTDIASGESFPELDPKQFSFNSPRGWCPTCRGHGRIFDWMLKPDEDEEMSDEVADALRAFDPDDPANDGKVCPTCHGERLNRIARAVRLPLQGNRKSRIENPKSSISLPELLRLTPEELLATLGRLEGDARTKLITQDIVP
ncbi:MAG: excinuclease subunit, partial [Verrucomicrobiota bacterium]|nr:excinuclease subunit [Verrucomicrobiota bacterium]